GRLETRERSNGFRNLHVASDRNRDCGKSVECVVVPNQRQVRMLATVSHDDFELGTIGTVRLQVLGTNVGVRGCSVLDDPTLEVATELGDVFIIRIQDGRSRRRKGFHKLVLSASYSRE